MKYQGKITDPKDLVTKEYIDDKTAPVETSPTAAAYAVDDLLIYNGILYRVTQAIAIGGTLTVGTNITATNLDTERGRLKSALIFVPETGNAGFHNSIYRGKYLGTSVTAAQYAAIDAGTFDDLFIGDYWTIDGVNWRIAHFDYWYNKGNTACTTHHVVIVPDSLLATSVKMNNSDVTTGGYMGSDFYTGNNGNTGRATARNKITSAFGSAHVLTHRMYLTNAVTNGYPSGGVWTDASVELMNEINVYGCLVYTSAINGTAFPNKYTIDNSQFALFAHDPSRMCIRSNWWLRDVASGDNFANVNGHGNANGLTASYPLGVRPAFAIVA